MSGIPHKARTSTYVVVLTLALGVCPAAWAQEGSQEQSSHASQRQEVARESSQEEPQEESRLLYWDQGLHLGWKQLNLRIAGSVQNDSAGFANVTDELVEEVGPIENGVEWRRARLLGEGNFFDRVDWKFQYDFAVNNPPQLKDAYMGIRLPNFGLGEIHFRGGRFKAPLSLEGNTSAVNTTFMERGVVAAFLPARNTGFLLGGTTDGLRHKIHWNIGAMKPEDELGSTDTDNLGVAGRFTYTFEPGGRDDVRMHAGIDLTRRDVSDTMNYLSRPESHLAPSFVDTGDIAANGATAANLETAVMKGPLSFQGEFAWAQVQTTDESADPSFYAFYVYASYFLTGEQRPYDVDRGAFGPIVPHSDFRGQAGGAGAIELALRFSRIDLTDEEIAGGIMNNLTGAFNWYASRNARVLTNVIRSRVEGFDPVWIFQVRLQWAY